MDWQRIKSILCEARRFSAGDDGALVLSDTLMPSGGLIHIHFQARTDYLFVHDNGAAFDELARHGTEIRNLRGVRAMLAETGHNLSDDGVISLNRVPPEQAHDALVSVADASVRAATYMVARGKVPRSPPLDRRLQNAMRLRFPHGHANFAFEGRHRQHTFDFGVVEPERTILLQAVSPEQSSIASAVLKSLDAKATGSNVVAISVYDPADPWQSGALNMLGLAGPRIEIKAIAEADIPLAA